MNPGASQRIDAHADVCAANRVHVEHAAEIAYVGIEVTSLGTLTSIAGSASLPAKGLALIST